MNKHYSDKEIILAIQEGGQQLEKMVTYLYSRKDLKDWVVHFVIRNQGSKEDAEDVFQEGISHFVMNVKNGKYQSKSTLKTYLISICKRLWYAIYHKAEKLATLKANMDSKEELTDSPEAITLYKEQADLLKGILEQLGEKCQQILELWSLGYSMKEIAKKVGYKNENVVSKKKHNCQKKLTAFLKERPDLVNRLNNN